MFHEKELQSDYNLILIQYPRLRQTEIQLNMQKEHVFIDTDLKLISLTLLFTLAETDENRSYNHNVHSK